MTDQSADQGKEVTLPKAAVEELEKKRRHAILIEQIKIDLKTNPKYRKFFDAYNSTSVGSFIEDYARKKARCLDEGRNYIGYQENDLLRFEREGEKCLEQILEKKLFDKECLWRAERITIPGVEHTSDFIYWENHIGRCPFLTPITGEEVEVFVEYVLSDLYDEYPETSWCALKKDEESDSDEGGGAEYPEFFTLFDLRFGTGGLIKLPDLRTPKEDFYENLAYEEKRKKREEDRKKSPPSPPPDTRPLLEYYRPEVIENFIRQFEDEKILRYFHIMRELDEPYMDDDLNEAIDMLKSAGEAVPIEAANNWRDAVVKAWDAYHRKKLAEGIRVAYEEYRLRLESGVIAADEEEEDHWDIFRKHQKANVIRGRVLNGEPPDFNF